VVGYGSGGLAVIEPAGGVVLQCIPLPTHPESFQLDSNKGCAFVNLPDAHQISVVDLNARKRSLAGKCRIASALTSRWHWMLRAPPCGF
jgi:hypothetical protein